jgi:hypothetical protein
VALPYENKSPLGRTIFSAWLGEGGGWVRSCKGEAARRGRGRLCALVPWS